MKSAMFVFFTVLSLMVLAACEEQKANLNETATVKVTANRQEVGVDDTVEITVNWSGVDKITFCEQWYYTGRNPNPSSPESWRCTDVSGATATFYITMKNVSLRATAYAFQGDELLASSWVSVRPGPSS